MHFKQIIGKPQDPSTPATPATAPASTPAPAPTPQTLRPPAHSKTSHVAPEQPVAYTAPGASSVSAGTRNILSSDVDIKGIVRFTNDLLVDGRIEGEIHSDGNLTVGENARLRAEIHTGSIFVHGKVHGNITANERVELRAGSEVVGDIKAMTLFIEAGAVFVGKSEVGTPSIVVEPGKKPGPQAATQTKSAAPQRQASAPKQPQQQQGNRQGQGNKQKGQASQGGLFNKK